MPDVERSRRIYELIVLTAWADGKVAAAEALAVHEIVARVPALRDIGSKSELSKGVKARIDAQGLDAALREAAAAIVEREDRELAFRCCARVLDADGGLGAEDADALATLQELFAFSGDDVKRLMAHLHD
jgi:hypothetical protein